MPVPLSAAPSPRDRLAELAWRARRAVLIRRRLLAFVLAVVAVLAGLRATASPAAETVAVTVAARDLPAGTILTPGDLREVDLAASAAPDGRVDRPAGRVLAGAVRRGEALTDARLVGPGLGVGRLGQVVTPVRMPDAGLAGLLRVGDRIDLLAVDAEGGEPVVLVRDCPVLALPAADRGGDDAVGPTGTTGSGRLVVLGVPESQATSVSGASVSHFLTYTFAR